MTKNLRFWHWCFTFQRGGTATPWPWTELRISRRTPLQARLEGPCDCGHEGLDEWFHLRPCLVAERRFAQRRKNGPA